MGVHSLRVSLPNALSVLLFGSLIAACHGGNSSPPPNRAPNLVLGLDQTVVETKMVTLSAIGSSDPDGTISTISWTQTSGPDVTLNGSDTLTPSFPAPTTNTSVTLTFQITLTDDDGASSSGTTSVTVDPNVPPVADAGSDQVTVENQTVDISASGSSDSDGAIVSYQWIQLSGPSVTLAGADTDTVSFAAPSTDTQEVLSFQLTVTDDVADTGVDAVDITVEADVPPQLDSYFPCDGCRLNSSAITVTGTASLSAYPSTVAQPTDLNIWVSAGLGSVLAILSNDGRWTAENVPVDNSGTSVDVSIDAVDTYGATSNIALHLVNRPTLTEGYVYPDPVDSNSYYFYERFFGCSRILRVDTAADSIDTIVPCDGVTGTLDQVEDTQIDAVNNRLLFSREGTIGSLWSFDFDDGSLTPISDVSHGTGDSLSLPRWFRIDQSSNRAIVWEHNPRSIVEVDLSNGDRTTLADNSGGDFDYYTTALAMDEVSDIVYLFTENPGFDGILKVDFVNSPTLIPGPGVTERILNPSYARFDPNSGLIFELSHFFDQLVSVDPVTGVGVLVSDTGTSGITMVAPNYFTFDHDGNVLASNFSSNNPGDLDAAVSIDISSPPPGFGARSIVLDDVHGTGPQLDFTTNVLLDPSTNTIYTLSSSAATLMTVDLTTNTRTVISGGGAGGGVDFTTPIDLALDKANSKAYVLDRKDGVDPPQIIQVDMTTGDRSTLSSSGDGMGPDFVTLEGVVLDASSGGRLLVTDSGIPAVISVDLVTGQRIVISDNANAGDDFISPTGIDLDDSSGTLLVTDSGTGATTTVKLFSVDLASGDRTTVSSLTVGTGPAIVDGNDVQIVHGSPRALVAESGEMKLVDLTTGNRVAVPDFSAGNGEALTGITKIGLDQEKQLIYSISRNYEALFAIEMGSGDRVVVSK